MKNQIKKPKVNVFWFRRDLRLDDNAALFYALNSKYPVLLVFIFDTNITLELPSNDARISFIYENLKKLNTKLSSKGSCLYCFNGEPIEVWPKLTTLFDIAEVYVNKDYEPYAIKRDIQINNFLSLNNISFNTYKDQCIFEENEIVKADGNPYTVFTPYKNKWLKHFNIAILSKFDNIDKNNFLQLQQPFLSLQELGFTESEITVKDYNVDNLADYDKNRNIPHIEGTSFLSPHLRFGTVSLRTIIRKTIQFPSFINELIWREFFMQILFHFPKVVHQNFKSKYNSIEWRNNNDEFEKWCTGNTGYPLVDAGMRELNQTGYMHNRVRMITSGFLCKHLLIDWQWGEAYFAQKLLDYELSSNNGNWQWAAGTGCDAAPYFRIFNPYTQAEKFDKEMIYIKKYIPEYGTSKYPTEIVEHRKARERCIETYKKSYYQ